jgi:magnesium chelatase subunit I
MVNWFGNGHAVDLLNDIPLKDYRETLNQVPGLRELVKSHHPKADEETTLLLMEFVLFGLAEFSFLSKHQLEQGMQFKDLLSSMLTISQDDEEEIDTDTFQ